MKNVRWMIGRLKAMSIGEIVWRLKQKKIKKAEQVQFAQKELLVTEKLYDALYMYGTPKAERMRLNWNNTSYSLNQNIDLLCGFSYEKFKTDWNAGFWTENRWPVIFSYNIAYSAREDIGDVRTNWELNRHFQFAMLAKNFYATGEQSYSQELDDLFTEWIQKNPFLHGVSWTSPMEIAIRTSNWIFTWLFVHKADEKYECNHSVLLAQLDNGIVNMVEYIRKHYSRYSSANNHLIVEMYAIALAGILYDNDAWKQQAIDILTKELPRQNTADGVNREMSMHYQTFVMEAYGLLAHFLKGSGTEVPNSWLKYLSKMTEFVADCTVTDETVIEFGDNDEGKIFDLSGQNMNYYQYVLQLMSLLMPKRYTNPKKPHENIYWLFDHEAIQEACNKLVYDNSQCKCYSKGGYTILRSKDNRIVIAIDHAPLGFDKLAAHGHADALSFQMFVDGVPVFVDPGTYNYHVPASARKTYRSTANHNTVQLDDIEQSEMLGSFLWGNRADTKMLNYKSNEGTALLTACTKYQGIEHTRTFKLKDNTLIITDELKAPRAVQVKQQFLVNSQLTIDETNGLHLLNGSKLVARIESSTGAQHQMESFDHSPAYGKKLNGQKIIYLSSGITIRMEVIITVM